MTDADARIAFDIKPLTRLRWIEISLDIIMIIDISLKFFTATYIDRHLVKDKREIAFNYIFKGRFFIELFQCLPGLITLEQIDFIYYFKVTRFFSISKLM